MGEFDNETTTTQQLNRAQNIHKLHDSQEYWSEGRQTETSTNQNVDISKLEIYCTYHQHPYQKWQ